MTAEHQALKELVIEDVSLAHVFERYGIDYSCEGNETLENACSKKGLNVVSILQEIEHTKRARPYSFLHFDLWDVPFLIDYIIANHHRYARETMPVLLTQLSQLREHHAEAHRLESHHDEEFLNLIPVAMLFERATQDIEQHMRKEELILFPYFKSLAYAFEHGSRRPEAFFATIEEPLGKMESEHSETAQIFMKIRALLEDYEIPDGAPALHRSLVTGLQAFFKDIHQHVHLENNLLFPRLLEIERALNDRNTASASRPGIRRTSKVP